MDLGGKGKCSHTDNSPPEWWQVDLQKVCEISKVAITGRAEPTSKFKCRTFAKNIKAFWKRRILCNGSLFGRIELSTKMFTPVLYTYMFCRNGCKFDH